MNANIRHSLTSILAAAAALFWLGAGAGWSQIVTHTPAAPPARPKTDTSQIKLGATCVTSDCHGDLKQAKFLHGPVNLNQCAPCHTPVNNTHVFKAMPAERKQLCQTCHQIDAPKADVHKPFAADCLLCHDPHGGDNRLFVKGGTGADGCIRCHDDPRKGLQFLHGPVAVGECLTCHTAHQSDNKMLLTDPPSNLCQNCHVDVQKEMQGAVSVHAPVKNDCTGCHQAHGGNVKFFLVAQNQDLCRKCHGEFLAKMEKVKHPHTPMTEGKSCSNCHLPHASNQQKLLIANNMELCLSCHNKTIQDGPRTIANVDAQIKGSNSVHGPIREKNCIACHMAHGSDNPAILEKPFPADFYASFTEHSYDLCFDCHDRSLVEHDKSTTTGFRNGETNLHFLHVNREKGRSCRACHAEHASDQPKHIRDSVPFGRWTMEVKYTKTDTGGTCATGCHVPYSYDRNKPVANKSLTAMAAQAASAKESASPPASPAPEAAKEAAQEAVKEAPKETAPAPALPEPPAVPAAPPAAAPNANPAPPAAPNEKADGQ